MSDDFGRTLKHLRESAGLSLADLAKATCYSKAAIGHVETGERPASVALAKACDETLGTSPLLEMLCQATTRGDLVRRRELLEHVGILTATGIGMAGIAEVVRQGLLNDAGIPVDWEEIVADYAREFVVAPSQEFGARLLQDMMLLRRQLREQGGTPELFRAAAGLANFYGLWLGNQGDLASATRQYRSAATLADHSGDTGLGDYIRGRTAARGTFEGVSVRQTETSIAQILTGTGGRYTIGALEAYCADAHLAGLMRDQQRGRRAVHAMRTIAEHLPDDADVWGAAGPGPRTALLDAYIECRCGTWADAQAAYERSVPLLAPWPMWLVEVELYLARAMVNQGYVRDGLVQALDTVRPIPHSVRVIGVAVRDVLTAVPAKSRGLDEVAELERYASPGPGPWATLR